MGKEYSQLTMEKIPLEIFVASRNEVKRNRREALQELKDVDYFVYRKMKFPPEDLIDVERPPFELLLTTKK